MQHNVLLTGASGYLGGTLLARWESAKLPPYGTLFALVRTDQQGESVRQLGATPIKFDVKDEAATTAAIISNRITIVLYLIDAMESATQVAMIKALAQVKKQTGQEVHILHTSGAKLFSNHSGHPIDRSLPDDDPSLFEIQKTAKPLLPPVQRGLNANNTVIETAEEFGVRSYIFVPCIVYGQGEGFGNPISIQTVAIVKAAKKLGKLYRPDESLLTWPVAHVLDNTTLYLEITRNILSDKDIPHGKHGYYLASSGSIAWNDIYCAMAKALAKRQLIGSDVVELADNESLKQMGNALGCPSPLVSLFLGGQCTLQSKNGLHIGWKPQFPSQHILDAADAEVDIILRNLE
ncbi:uncharacterized protein N7511_008709 [Penicillium nucicola]|uniref:uncharacterized protein n=1 Tax=Penicillium nucicola TaxID=1850975 RepID=UPI00254597BA|nr:uncharacterized protein N7511_008709 [Penicillium nucicola]KAJ5747013.1 hypothetical protein N7511_008709 [Penicillium nucicola]